MTKIQLTLGKISNRHFWPAFKKLCALPFLHSKDAYALARTINGLESELAAYEKAYTVAIRNNGGISNLKPMIEQMDKLRGGENPSEDNLKKADELEKQVKGLQEAGMENWSINRNDAGWLGFLKEIEELNARPVELFLDHKVKLPETLTDKISELGRLVKISAAPEVIERIEKLLAGMLTPEDLRELLEVIEE